MIAKDGGVEIDSEGWGEWRMIAKDGGSVLFLRSHRAHHPAPTYEFNMLC